jgi:hypothetical protein
MSAAFQDVRELAGRCGGVRLSPTGMPSASLSDIPKVVQRGFAPGPERWFRFLI